MARRTPIKRPGFEKTPRQNCRVLIKRRGRLIEKIRDDAFRVNRDQAMNLEIWFKIHTNVSNFETASPKSYY